ncbi:mevalonate kinase [Acidobacteriota bacterium]
MKVSAPGRICLFGEHQDYFGLPVIAAAINLRIHISGKAKSNLNLEIDLPDIDEFERIDLESEVRYTRKRDYLKSVINVLQREGISFHQGWDCTVQGSIPINSGTSSSSALVVAWIKFLLEAAPEFNINAPHTIAELAFRAEVAEFNEPGGKMDHYASALGGIVNIHFDKELNVHKYANPLKEFVLADSLIRKDTTSTLAHIKTNVLEGVALLQKRIKGFQLKSKIRQRERAEIERLPAINRRFVEGTLKTRDLVAQGESLFQTTQFDHKQFGQLLNSQQDVLREYIGVSSPKLDQMIATSLEQGALGAKINGSGEGGCIFAYCPENAREVADTLEKLGAKTYIIHIDEGVKLEA